MISVRLYFETTQHVRHELMHTFNDSQGALSVLVIVMSKVLQAVFQHSISIRLYLVNLN